MVTEMSRAFFVIYAEQIGYNEWDHMDTLCDKVLPVSENVTFTGRDLKPVESAMMDEFDAFNKAEEALIAYLDFINDPINRKTSFDNYIIHAKFEIKRVYRATR